MSPYEAPSANNGVPEDIRVLLAKSYFAYLCTVDERNRPHITPIFFAYDENTGLTYFMSSSESTKIQNIRQNKRVSLTADVRDHVNPFNNVGVMIEGEAEIEHELTSERSPSNEIFTESALRAFERFKRKYGIAKEVEPSFSRSMSVIRRFSEVLVSIRPKKIVHWKGGGRFRRVEFYR